jgi:hypothetical protein
VGPRGDDEREAAVAHGAGHGHDGAYDGGRAGGSGSGSGGAAPFLLDVLAMHASRQPNETAWTFLDDHGSVVETYTYVVSFSTDGRVYSNGYCFDRNLTPSQML